MTVVILPQVRTWKAIPTQLTLAQFHEFVLPHLTTGTREPQPKLDLHKMFNYILKLLYLGCQWKELPIEKDVDGLPEIHYTALSRDKCKCDSFWRTPLLGRIPGFSRVTHQGLSQHFNPLLMTT
ncbi:hypothetical protein [Chroococcidiopsis sp. SAG 2025]|uniref:hypothetical protein n=1 Tax=Chroococcidiopsis sp. SAG 2025 TaxID=171389 RepID=UPI0029373DBE|nr:hypothetical protein [Chroococcidiopsis sp. SAG 2025]